MSNLEAKYRRFVKNVSYHDWWEYHYYLTWLYYCHVFKVDPHDLDQYYNWALHSSLHPRFIKEMKKDGVVYNPEWDLQSNRWKDHVKKHPNVITTPKVRHSSEDSNISIRHHLWIHDRMHEYDREAFRRWKKVGANAEDMKKWKDWISWKDNELENHRKYLKKKRPNCGCIYCGAEGGCSCRGWENEVARKRSWKKLRAKLLR